VEEGRGAPRSPGNTGRRPLAPPPQRATTDRTLARRRAGPTPAPYPGAARHARPWHRCDGARAAAAARARVPPDARCRGSAPRHGRSGARYDEVRRRYAADESLLAIGRVMRARAWDRAQARPGTGVPGPRRAPAAAQHPRPLSPTPHAAARRGLRERPAAVARDPGAGLPGTRARSTSGSRSAAARRRRPNRSSAGGVRRPSACDDRWPPTRCQCCRPRRSSRGS
jgi:hypothetical protein